MLKIISSVVVSVALSVGAMLGVIHAVEPAKVDYSTIRQATWRLQFQAFTPFGEPVDASCSGTFIKEHIMLTAAHCYGGDMKVDGHSAVMLKMDKEKDLMILYVNMDSAVLPVAKATPAIDAPVVVCGFPLGLAEFVTVGRVQDELQADGAALLKEFLGVGSKFLVISAPISGGNSGGGVFVKGKNGYELVGVVSIGGGIVALAVDQSEINAFLK